MGIWFDTHFTNDQTDKQKVLASLLDYVEVCITATGENQLSLVDVCADSWDFEGNADNWITLNGGLAQIADTLAKRLTGPIHTNARVVKIDSTDAGVQLTYTSNVTGCQKTTKYFTSVICATPSHNLRFIEMNPPFSYEKFHAIRSLNYDRSTKVFLQFPKRFWDPMAPPQIKHETGGQHTAIAKKAPGASIGQGGTTSTDLPVFKVVYPSYGTNPDLCVLLASYTWTNDSDLIANMDHIERVALCLHNLRRLHGQDVVPDAVDYKVQLWQQAYALFYAGQFTHTFGPMVQSEHEVYFAGEHLSTRHAWIEGAIDSAAEAVLLLLREHELPIPPEVERWAEDSPWFEPESQPKPDTTSG
jgi:monoamine oxidase